MSLVVDHVWRLCVCLCVCVCLSVLFGVDVGGFALLYVCVCDLCVLFNINTEMLAVSSSVAAEAGSMYPNAQVRRNIYEELLQSRGATIERCAPPLPCLLKSAGHRNNEGAAMA